MPQQASHQTSPFSKTKAELEALRDELRLNLHLAGMDAKSEWDRLEPKLREIETQLETRLDNVSENKTATLAKEIRSVLQQLHDRMGHSHVSDVMTTKVAYCSLGDSFRGALQIMWDRDCGVVPIVDDGGKVIAMITDRDLAMAGYTRGELEMGSTVVTSMSPQLHTCRAEHTLGEAMAMMREYRVRRLPVVDDEGHLIGLVALADIARWAYDAKAYKYLMLVAETLSTISAPRTTEDA